jgi:hypothetical protein
MIRQREPLARDPRRADPSHAQGKRKLGPPPEVEAPPTASIERRRHQPWVPTSGLVGRKRRSARRS